MKTTLRIKDDLYRAANARAALEGVTITKFIEDALHAKLHRDANKSRRSVEFPTFDGGRFPYSPEELKHLIEDSQMEHDLKNLRTTK
jgi:hypothetical protein